MDPHPPFDHPHHRRAHPGHHHHYLDQHHLHHLPGGGGGGSSVALARSRYDYEYDSHPMQYLPSDHHHQRVHHQPLPQPPPPSPQPLPPPPPTVPHHRHDGPHYATLRAPPEPCSPPPPYRNPTPPHYPYHPQRHGGSGGDDFRAADEIRPVPSHHHAHHLQPQHHHQQPPHHHQQPPHHHQQLSIPWEEAEEERRRYAAHQLRGSPPGHQFRVSPPAHQLRVSPLPPHQLRASPPGGRKRYRCAMHDTGDQESTSSSGPPPRRQRQQLHPGYSPPSEDGFVDRVSNYSGYSSHEGFVNHSDSNGGRMMPMSASAMPPGSPNSMVAGYSRRAQQKIAPTRVSVWQRIEENPAVYAPPSPRKVPMEVHISPSKAKNSGLTSKELASVISLDCKAKSADSKDSCDNSGMKKNAVKKNDKVLASVIVKPKSVAKEKDRSVTNKVTKKPDKVEKIPGFTGGGVGSTAFPAAGGKKVKKIVIKKIVRKIGAKGKQTSSPIVSEKKDVSNGNANASEKEEGEITSSSFEKDTISAHNLVSTSDTTGVGNTVEVQKEHLVDLRKSSMAPTIASTDTPDTASVSSREHPGKEDDKSFVNSLDGDAAPVIKSTKTFNTTGEHPGREEDGGFVDSQKEVSDEIMAVSVALNVARTHEYEQDNIENKVPEVLHGNKAAYMYEGKDDTEEVSGTRNSRKEEGDFLVNHSIGRPMTAEVSMTMSKDDNEKESMILMGASEVCVASLGDSEGAPKIAEATVTQGYHKEEGNTTLNNPRENDVLSASSSGTLNALEISVNENKEKEYRLPIEPSETPASFTHLMKASEVSVIEDIQKESQMAIHSSSSEKIQCPKALTAEFTSTFVQSEAGNCTMDSSRTYVGTSDKSLGIPEFVVVDRTEDSSMQCLLHDAESALSKVVNTEFSDLRPSVDMESTILPPLDDDPMEDSSGAFNLNNGVGRNTTSQVAELTPNNNFSLHSHDSPSVSGNSEHSIPTALTLGNNIYFSSAESEGQPEKNHNLVEANQGFDVVTVTEFGDINKRKGESGNDLINAGVQNWLTLPLTVSYVNNDATGSTDRLDSDQIMDEGASYGRDDSLNLCGSNMPASDLLATKERNKDVENESDIDLPGSVNSVNVLDQCSIHTMDKPILLSSQSIDAPGRELSSSQVYVNPDHTYHSNTEDPVAASSTKPDSLSSWIEAIVLEAKKEQSGKSIVPSTSIPDKLSAPKEDSRKAVSDSVVSSVVKSPPRINTASSTVLNVPTKQVTLPSSLREPPRLNQNARNRTWRRDNVSSSSSLHVSQPSGLPPKLPVMKNGKNHNSYIRKGNALIRNPATVNQPHSSNLDAQSKFSKPVMRRSLNFVRKVDPNDAVAHSNISVERPKTPPLPLHTKSISCAVNLLEPSSQTLQKQQVLETEKEDSSGQVNSGVDNAITTLHKSEPLDAGKSVYVRQKSNQLFAAQEQHPGDPSNSSRDKVLLLQPSSTSDLYFKKRKNQIVLGSSTADVSSAKDMTQAENIKSGESKSLMFASSNNNVTVAKDRPHKEFQKQLLFIVEYKLFRDSEEATLAVAEVERKKREKRKRQALRIKGRNGMCVLAKVTNWSEILRKSFQKECPIVLTFCKVIHFSVVAPMHVKVNSNAPVCEDFLKGYCADGDECPQESRCKLYHPKKKNKSKRRVDTLQNNSWGRYFDTSIDHGSGTRVGSSEEEERQKVEQVSGDEFADFIDLGAVIEVAGDVVASDDMQMMELDSGNLKMQADNLDALIKPLRIMRTARV
ncbi:hypothetical protein HU200_042783 [Digitaria exilis]|uniref:C3H1-type domain-containing protein n=1 Tax=Digitaria exilis TaxID=1010633 RepID=A0A835EFS1_9POAL|nr:hypothetical protein HU200_042783 [Digitaria exilis]